jgi:hypothetical protein
MEIFTDYLGRREVDEKLIKDIKKGLCFLGVLGASFISGFVVSGFLDNYLNYNPYKPQAVYFIEQSDSSYKTQGLEKVMKD